MIKKRQKSFNKTYRNDGQDKLLPRLSLFLFGRYKFVAVMWIIVTLFGIASYTVLMKREGFPSINIPFTMISGSYVVNDPQKVDAEVAKPISDIVLKDSHVMTVQSQSRGTFYTVFIQYKDGTNATVVGKQIQQRIVDAHVLPPQAQLKVETPRLGFTERGDDGVIAVYSKDKKASPQAITAEAQKVATYIQAQHFADMRSVSVIDPFVSGVNPLTGKLVTSQRMFDRYGVRQGESNNFYDAISVGYMQKTGTDVLKLNTKIQKAVDDYNSQHKDSNFTAVVSATYATNIKEQISELQRSLLEGLIAVLIIGSIVIAIRASLITVISMLTVLASTVGVLYLFGYTLNTITMFALILCLGLVVDDTIIMVEAIDAQRRKSTDRRETVKIATRKVSRAMVSATLTAALSFTPLLFVGGILGSFIRAIPITVITSLLVSLTAALIFIPLFARYLLLGKKQMGAKNIHEPAAAVEAKIAQFVGKPMLWAQNSRKKLFLVGTTAVVIGFGFIAASGVIFQKVTFNIFPPSKDSDGLSVQMAFDPGTSITQAESLADKANQQLATRLGANFQTASYYARADAQTATLTVTIIPYSKRVVTAPQLEKTLNDDFKSFQGAKVTVSQQDVGPPPSVFSVQLETTNRTAAEKLAKDINSYLLNRELVRPSGAKAKITATSISDPGTYSRKDGKLYTEVTASFDGTDTSTLVTLAQKAVQDEFTTQKLQTYGLSKDVLKFDIGQEQQNQDSFKTLALAFPIVLLAIYLLLTLQFRSLVQPLLIFMAIPFSLFGITLGLYLTDNAFSFFAMLGFFALIGLSIKNTILLTDYANQLRRSGLSVVDSAVGAIGERFRPLIATSFTAVVSLIPLALSSPFWQGLSVVLISGLLSSTFLVITVFPYYYLGTEFLRLHISRRACLTWLALTILAGVVITKAGLSPGLIPVVSLGVIIAQVVLKKRSHRRAA